MREGKWRRLQRMNLAVVGILVLITLIGAAMLYSAAGGSISPWAGKQLVRFAVGLIILFIIALVDVRTWSMLAYPFYMVSLFFLIAVEAMGFIGMGAQRWLDLYVFNLQPSELMKISLVLALARYLHHCTAEQISHVRTLVLPSLMILLPTLFVMRQPDLGTAIILLISGISLFFVAGVRWWKFVVAGLAVSASMPVFWSLLRDYQKNRILTFLNPEQDPLQTGYHIMQSKIALGSGGFWGKGFMQGTQSHLNFLPEKQTDFIFTMLCEEFGFMGGVIVLLLYVLLIAYGFFVAIKSHHAFGRYLALGMTTTLFSYVFINMAMVVGLVPVVGLPLPLLSYGGTAVLTLMIGMGLVFSVAIHHDVRMGR
ncbi:MAG: rod shape-determining protein RodA [Alphaproteobacteria bacterium]